LSETREIAASLLLLIGLGFTLVGSIGLVRLPDFYTRMHAPTKATTLGVSTILAAAALAVPGGALAVGLKAALVIALLFITAPAAAHMLAKAARCAGLPPGPETRVDELPPAPEERRGEGPAGS
jgi:multicomponent K+:H+ antiporter subunit G